MSLLNEIVYKRADGSRIKIECSLYREDVYVKIYKAPKGKRFSLVAPLSVTQSSIDGYRHNGAGILDSNNRMVFYDYAEGADHSENLKYLYITKEEEQDAKSKFIQLLTKHLTKLNQH